MRIGIIDSGRGGKYIAKRLKDIYKVDTVQYSPLEFESYAAVSQERLFMVADTHLTFLKEEQVDMIIVGCMTLSVNCLNYIKSKAHTRVYDLYSNLPYLTSNITVLGTENTVKSGRFNYCKAISCGHLSSAIENNIPSETIEKLIEGFVYGEGHTPTNTVLLGCSHYAWIQNEISNVMAPEEILDPVIFLLHNIEKILANYEL